MPKITMECHNQCVTRLLPCEIWIEMRNTGHEMFMPTLFSGSSILDEALLLVAANEICPQPQTFEHMAATGIMLVEDFTVLVHKVDLMERDDVSNQYTAIQNLIKATVADGAPVIPVSALCRTNLEMVPECIVRSIPVPVRNFTSPAQMIIIRSSDVNKPGSEADSIRGGFASGHILKGVLKLNQNIEIRPGVVVRDDSGNFTCTPIFSRIVSLFAERN